MDDGDLDFSNPDNFLCPAMGNDPPSSCSMDSYFDDILKDTEHHACTHTHTCNPPVHDNSHTHTCVHVHTKIVAASPEAAETADSPSENNTSKKRPSGNRAAVRKYREKKKAHTASLEEEVVHLRAQNQQLMKKLQNHAALEAEVARLRCLLVDIRGRIEGEIGAFPYQRPIKNIDLVSSVDQGSFLGGAQVNNSCDFRCNDQMYCNPGMQGAMSAQVLGQGACDIARLLAVFMVSPFQRLLAKKLQVNAEESSDDLANPPKIEEKLGAVPHGLSTDSEVTQREAESISRKTLRSSAEKFEFQAEVSRLMDIIINSLYSNKDIFLRELISNASDALDKIRFLSLTDKEVLGEGDTAKLEIQIKLDKEKKILSIRDRGIGMTKEDLIKNLGTIAKSGTSAFVEKMQSGGDLNLIGQFGVGFYSVYLVADYVEVVSKHNDDKQYVWESKADGAFAISEDTWNEPLGRGTEIRLHLRDEAKEYLEEDKLKDLVKKYSEFINFPIYLWSTKEVDVEVPADEEETSEEEESTPETTEEEETEESEEKKPKTKTIKETTSEWELLNDVKAVWLRSPKEVTDEEYSKFYHSLAKDFSDDKPMSWSHFTAEGDVEFKALLFVPPKAPHDLYESYYNNNKSNLKLYVRRVFISDEFDDLLPKYLNFLKGIVDSDTLPLNVSREMLQQHSSLKTIKKKLIRKALDMIRKIAEEDPDEYSNKDKTDEEKSEMEEKKGQYAKFWNEFGKSIKLGIIEDATNRNRLAKLLRFESTKSDGKLASLDEYISRMKPGQKDIFYITGSSKEQLEKSPFLERLTKKNYEVIFFTDPVDEYLMQYLMDYEDKKFQNVSKEGLKLGKDSKLKDLKESFKELTDWWKKALESENVDSVKISNRLHNTPCVVVTSKYGWSANMEKIMQAQTLSDSSKQAYMRGKRVLEINPRHPIIKELRDKVAQDNEGEGLKQTARLVYQTALMESGFNLPDPKDFASSIYRSVQKSLDLSPDATVEEEDEAEEQPEIEEKESAKEESEPSYDKDEL
ncbi:Endoplasmin-like protein [Dichanthelium oligosanthes]|uniref:Endoplasmin homolog n=1 Tax=Dichanthelium oligosanthes TaxID=888268 RepID=A0A1E5VLH3_9POAL|nr:Endoplasmin-like protein [Dichanthelium oligosanthes]